MTTTTKPRKSPKKSAGQDPSVALDMKVAPLQERARATIELIIDVTGKLLAEVGVERLSTNMVCERAGITPPALYRYFPNKYAILHEMSRRLMEAEDAVVFDWLEQGQWDELGTLEDHVARQTTLARRVRQVTLDQPGGLWILRVMRAVPILREVRAQSVSAVADAISDRLLRIWQKVDPALLRSAALLTTNLSTAVNEMVIDEPELEEEITGEFAKMVALYYRDLLLPAATGKS